jgi:hypothetical protein
VSVHFVFVHASELGPYVEGLRAIERATSYPIADGRDSFTIDHGDRYEAFFTTMGQDVRFLLAVDGDRVVGGIAGMYRDVEIRGRPVRAVYGADWKLAREYRGTGVARRMLLWGASRMFTDRSLLGWRYAFVAAMRGARGDVMRTVKGFHVAKLAHAAGVLAVYFADPARLAALRVDGAPPPPPADDGVDLSAFVAGVAEEAGIVSTAGRKDLRLASTGAPWPLVHLPYGPPRWRPTWGAYLRACGEALVARRPGAVACFAVDRRLTSHISWLAAQGVEPGASCSVYAFDLTRRARRASWIHLATSEI